MARTRYIKPGFFKNEELAALDPLVRILFAGLWVIADREGRLEDRPKRIKAEILPYDEIDIDESLEILASSDDPFIFRYEVDGVRCIQIAKWELHQSPHHKELTSILPCVKHKSSKRQACVKNDPCLAQAPLELELESELRLELNKKEVVSEKFEKFWTAFPSGRKKSKGKARTAFAKASKKAPPDTIIAAAIEYASSPEGRGEFVKMPETWLNGECWTDDRTAWQMRSRGRDPTDPRGTKAAALEFLEMNRRSNGE